MEISEETVVWRTRVRYAETDQMGVVHHANYAVWFEASRSEFCRQRGIDYGQIERDGMLLPVLELRVRYLQPAHYEDEVEVHTRVIEIRRSLLRIQYEVRLGETKLAEGETLQMLVSKATFKPVRFPQEIAALFLPGSAE
ncbi:MAG: acyl-CoA thioester hydrolase, YbgC/YbaW family [Chthonomonadales bacterium]|nr:acyl-CoA thioester hydrolase, YbgC/YbaW family [Chthonomonadales bacterium]